LEYRGYGRAGISLLDKDLKGHKKAGKVSDHENFVKDINLTMTIGISHTSWATHGDLNHYSK
jgi:glucosamine--fructose-6-phosphate aminotransferase (isomerizing)